MFSSKPFLVSGHLTDVTGTYAWALRVSAFWIMFAGLVYFLEIPIRRIIGSDQQLLDGMPDTTQGKLTEQSTLDQQSLEDCPPVAYSHEDSSN